MGPVVIGDRCRIRAGAVIRSSVIGNEVVVAQRAAVQYSVVSSGSRASAEERIYRSVLTTQEGLDRVRPLAEAPTILTLVPESAPRPRPHGRGKLEALIKEAMDRTLSSLLLLLASPVFLLTALAIRLESRGPIFFKQTRCGKNGKEFRMMKFRTMVEDADRKQVELRSRSDVDGPVFKIYRDPRVTRVGAFLRRTSLDELPQILNVLRGEMSLVGPRPLSMNEMRFSPAWRDWRLSVKPGITGLWQVNGRSKSSFSTWVQHDVEYVKNQSLWLDLKILLKTAGALLRGEGAC